MLTAYLNDTKSLLQNPKSATAQIYTDPDLIGYVNRSRQQVAQRSKCIRVMGTVATVAGVRTIAFSSINIGTAAVTGVQGILAVRSINVSIGTDGQQRVSPRGWEWFDLYALNNPAPTPGVPAMWSQYAQGASGQSTGSSAAGSFYIDPPPDTIYTLNCDCECYPISLVDDTTVEAIPFGFTEAVKYYAARLALLSSQTGERAAMAEQMMQRFTEQLDVARQGSNPSVLTWQSQGATDTVQLAKLASMKGGQ